MRASDHKETTGKRLRRIRMQRGLTQGELGAFLGVGQSQVSRWERDEGEMWPSTRRDLAEALGVTQGWLATGSDRDVETELPLPEPVSPLQALRKSLHALAHAAAIQKYPLELEEALGLVEVLARETLALQRAPTTQDALEVLKNRITGASTDPLP